MVSVKMSDSKVWKICIGTMVNLIEEAAFKFAPEGIKMKAMDPSHVALVDFELPAAAFAEYSVKQPVTLGINLSEMDKVVSRAKADDQLILELDEKQNRLAVSFKGASTRKLSLPLIDVREAELQEPKIQFAAAAEILAGVVQDGLKDAELISDNVRLELSEEGFFISADGDRGSTELKLGKGDKGLVKLHAKEKSRAMFNIKYLTDMTKAASSTDVIKISLGSNLPIQLDFPVAGGVGKLRFLLAPRVESD